MAVTNNGAALKKMTYNGAQVKKWIHDGKIVFSAELNAINGSWDMGVFDQDTLAWKTGTGTIPTKPTIVADFNGNVYGYTETTAAGIVMATTHNPIGYNGVFVIGTEVYDVSSYTTLNITYSASGTSYGNRPLFGLMSSRNSISGYPIEGNLNKFVKSTSMAFSSSNTVSLDISELTGNYYIGITWFLAPANGEGETYSITNIWFS